MQMRKIGYLPTVEYLASLSGSLYNIYSKFQSFN